MARAGEARSFPLEEGYSLTHRLKDSFRIMYCKVVQICSLSQYIIRKLSFKQCIMGVPFFHEKDLASPTLFLGVLEPTTRNYIFEIYNGDISILGEIQ